MMRVMVSNNKRNSASKRLGAGFPQDGRIHADNKASSNTIVFFKHDPPKGKEAVIKPPL
jgi:hypothetical protein